MTADEWNAKYPVGTLVYVLGSGHVCETRGLAARMPRDDVHDACESVHVTGRLLPVPLDKLEPIT